MANHFLSNHFASDLFASNHFRGGEPSGVITKLPLSKVKQSTLALQVKLSSKCKIDDTTWLLRISEASTTLVGLESDLARLTSILRIVETTDSLLVMPRLSLDCKIGETDFDDKAASADVPLDSLASKISSLQSKMHALEASLRIHVRRQRINP